MTQMQLPVIALVNINSEQQVLDVVHQALEIAGLSGHILEGLRTTAEALMEHQVTLLSIPIPSISSSWPFFRGSTFLTQFIFSSHLHSSEPSHLFRQN